MPNRDGTGPIGLGAMSGRGAGFCTGFKNRLYCGTSNTINNEKERLTKQAKLLENQLQNLKNRISSFDHDAQ